MKIALGAEWIIDVVKSTFVFYVRGDLDGAEKLLKNALQRDPLYAPALSKLAELYWLEGRFAEAIKIAADFYAFDLDCCLVWDLPHQTEFARQFIAQKH